MSSVLYDVPGPKAKARNLTFSIVGTLVVVGLLVFAVLRIARTGQLAPEMWEVLQFTETQERLLEGLIATLKAFFFAGIFSLVLGVLLAVARLSDHLPIRWFAASFIELFRAVPLLITIFVFWQGFLINEPLWALVLGLTVYNGSVQAEVLRAGILAVPKGQVEAAYAVGMRKTQVMLSIQIPQAVRSMMPTIISQLVVTLKDTSLGYIIVYEELLYVARQFADNKLIDGSNPEVVVLGAAGAIYVGICLLLSWSANWIERRGRRAKTGIKVADAEPIADPDEAIKDK